MKHQTNLPLITVAIPFYNAEQFLGEAIDSVLSQTYKDWNLLLIDDGSYDNSLSIARTYEENDKRIKVFSDGHNRNLSFRLNQIPELVNTVYLARMDADDIMHPSRLEKQVSLLLDDPDIDVLGANAYSMDENGMVLGTRFHPSSNLVQKVEGFIHPTVVAKTEWFRGNKYDINALRIEDAELWYRNRGKSNFMMLTEPLLFYREVGVNYYKKYYLANSAKNYILDKYPNDKFWKAFFRNNVFKGFVYRIFNFFMSEKYLINSRNQVKFKSKAHYLNYINTQR